MQTRDVCATFHMNVATAPTSYEIFWASDTTNKEACNVSLRMVSSGSGFVVRAFDDAQTQIGTWTSSELALNTWHSFQLRFPTGMATSDTVIVRINGTEVLNETAQDIGTGASNDEWYLGKTGDANGAGYTAYFDDFITSEDEYPNEDHKIVCLRPDADGTHTDWTGGTGSAPWYTEVDEAVPDGGTTYIQATGTANDKFSFGCGSLSIGGSDTILAVQGICDIYDNITGDFRIFIRSGTTESQVASGLDASANYNSEVMRCLSDDPDTATTWTQSGVNALEVGGEQVASGGTVRTSWVGLNVAYLEVAGGDVNVDANLESFTFATYDATIASADNVTTNLKSFTFTTYPATITHNVDLATNVEAFTFTTYPATIAHPVDITTNVEAFTFTTYPADIAYGSNIDTNLQAFTFTTYPATITADVNIDTNVEAFTFTTYPATITYGSNVDTNVEAFTFTANAATIDFANNVDTNVAAFTFTTYPATIELGGDVDITTNLESFTFTTYAATIAGVTSTTEDGYLPSIRASDPPAVKAAKRNARYRYFLTH